MEDKQKFPFHKGYGKMLTASLLILTGLLLFARNSGMITEEYFNLLVAWHSLFIIVGTYSKCYTLLVTLLIIRYILILRIINVPKMRQE